MNLIRCQALRAFTQFVPGHGQVHGDPDNQDEAVQFPMVPESYVNHLAGEGKIQHPEPSLEDWAEAMNAGGDVDTVEPRALADGETLPAAPLFTVTHVSGPNFDVFGPGMDAPERIKGKAAAEARAAELEAAMSQPIDAPTPEGEGDGETATEDAAPV